LKLDFGGEDALIQEAQAQLEAVRETITYERKKKKENASQPVRQPLPAHLERKEKIIEPDPLAEGSKLMREEVTEVLEYTSGTLYVRRIVRRKYVLAKEAGVVIGLLPSLPRPKSSAGLFAVASFGEQISGLSSFLPSDRDLQTPGRKALPSYGERLVCIFDRLFRPLI
jgi:transposase